MFAKYSDSTKTAIIAVFDSPQDSSDCEEIDVSNVAYKTFYDSIPEYMSNSLPEPAE